MSQTSLLLNMFFYHFTFTGFPFTLIWTPMEIAMFLNFCDLWTVDMLNNKKYILGTYHCSTISIPFAVEDKCFKNGNMSRIPQCGKVRLWKLKCCWKLLQELPDAIQENKKLRWLKHRVHKNKKLRLDLQFVRL